MSLKILCIDSEGGQGTSWCMDCIAAGHDVKLWVNPFPDGTRRTAGDGLVPRVTDYHPWLKWADLIFCTGNAYKLKERDKLIEEGFPIFGAGTMGSRLEIDRDYAMKLLEKHGIKLIPYHEFNNLDQAQEFIKKNGGMYVVKTLGSEEDKSLTHVPSHKDYAEEEMISMFDKWKKLGKMRGQVMLQEFFPGNEICVQSHFGPGGWSKWKCIGWEHKKLMSHNYGPNCGEAGTVICYVEKSRLFDEILAPITEYLHAINYVGSLDANCIVNKDGKIGFLEFTARPGWPHWHLVQEVHKGDPAQWMLDLINGKDTLQVSTDVCIGIVVAQPNHPYTVNRNQESEGIPIFGVTEENRKHLHYADVRKNNKRIVTAGEYVMVVSAKAKTVKEAAKKAYDIVDYIGLPNKIVRDDVGEKLKISLPELHKHGIATEVEYE